MTNFNHMTLASLEQYLVNELAAFINEAYLLLSQVPLYSDQSIRIHAAIRTITWAMAIKLDKSTKKDYLQSLNMQYQP